MANEMNWIQIDKQDNKSLYYLTRRYPVLGSLIRDFIRDEVWVYYWAKDIGDQEIMRDRITSPMWAYHWARHIGDQEIMWPKVIDTKFTRPWKLHITGGVQ